MDDETTAIFDEFRLLMKAHDTKIIEVATPKSASYHNANAEVVCEVVARTHRILVLFGIDLSECVPCDLAVRDTADYKFIPHSQYDAGCFVEIYSIGEVTACAPLIRQALAVSMD